MLSYVMSYVMVTTCPNRKGIYYVICHGVTLKSAYVMLHRHMSLGTVMCICHAYMSWCHIEVDICHAIYAIRYVMLYRHMSLGTVMCIRHAYMSWCHIEVGICHVICHAVSAYVIGDCHVYVMVSH